jgi:peptidoglycan hydrolase-like protein with peptidoglycan-binding domain
MMKRVRINIRNVTARSLVAGFVGIALLGAVGSQLVPGAATAARSIPDVNTFQLANPDKLVSRIQKGLKEIGVFEGLVNGVLDASTEAAIRTYQRSKGIRPDGKATETLAGRIATETGVATLLKRLERVKRESMDTARKALLSQPETRDLVKNRQDEIADPTRNAAPCFREPTVQCLLAEAAESAKAVSRNDKRDWALGELLAAQAKAGLSKEARITLGRIDDPRLILVSLRDIAEAQAQAGHAAEALEATAIIPDDLKKVEAYAAIAEIQARRGDRAATLETIGFIGRTLGGVKSPVKRASFHARAGAVLIRIGDTAGGQSSLDTATSLARGQTQTEDRSLALRHVASALAEIGRPQEALEILRSMDKRGDKIPVLIAAATAQAEAGNAVEALNTAAIIDESRFRAIVLSRIASAQLRAADDAAAQVTISMANAAIEDIHLPFARDFALSRIAFVEAEIAAQAIRDGVPDASFDDAIAIAQDIADAKLKAKMLWAIAASQSRLGRGSGALKTQELAKLATQGIKSGLSKVWMFAEIAARHVDAGEPEAARSTLRRGLAVAEKIRNAWARTRALSKIASTLLRLADADQGAMPK